MELKFWLLLVNRNPIAIPSGKSYGLIEQKRIRPGKKYESGNKLSVSEKQYQECEP